MEQEFETEPFDVQVIFPEKETLPPRNIYEEPSIYSIVIVRNNPAKSLG